MAEKKPNALDLIRAMQEEVGDEKPATGSFSNEFFLTAKNPEKKVRILTELEDAHVIKYHQKKNFAERTTDYAHPCLNHYGLECPTCALDNKPNQMFFINVYDYENEFEPRKYMAELSNSCTPIPKLLDMVDMIGSTTTQDYIMKVNKPGTKDKNYSFKPVKDSADFDTTIVPYTLEEILEDFKKSKFKFVLPAGVVLSNLKEIGEPSVLTKDDGDDEVKLTF